jgi:DNA-binding NarL/FixJ family response regulator
MKVLLVDDHAIVRVGLKQVLADYGGVETGDAASGAEAMEKLAAEEWDLVILDIRLPDRSGLDVLKDIRARYPSLRVIVLTMYPEEQYAVRAMRAGASGYLAKDSVPEELLDAVSRVAEGRRYVTPSLAEKLAWAVSGKLPGHEALSDRELEVLRLLGSGKRVTEIAQHLGLSVKTVSTHRAHILTKMQL